MSVFRKVGTLRAVHLGDDALLLKSDHASCRIEGASARPVTDAIIPALSDWASLDEVCKRAKGYAQEDIAGLLDSLVDARLVIRRSAKPRTDGQRAGALQVLADIGIDEDAAAQRLATLRIGVVGSGENARLLSEAFEKAGVGEVRKLGREETLARESLLSIARELDCLLVVEDAARLAARHWANKAALANGCPAIFLDISSTEAVVGPTVLPGETGCYLCFRMRHLATRDAFLEAMAFERDLDKTREPVADRPSFPGLAQMALGAMMGEAFRLLFGPMRPDLANAIVVLDALEGTTARHEVLRQPDCPECRGIDTAVRHNG